MNKKGVTLVETIISFIILVIVNVSVLTLFVMLKASVLNMRHQLQAINILSSKMEQIKNQDYNSIIAVSGQTLTIDDNGTSASTADDTTGIYNQAITEIEDPDLVNKYKVITATLTWQEKSYAAVRSVNESLVTIISN